ncbi:hypothetical protein AMECASPLE_036217 [Ameca splendens]|uniref:Uncharacterized protein n=1 Tax=Ameca splendens TaxID=208324 RepID=A0ABV1A4J5_9TELE
MPRPGTFKATKFHQGPRHESQMSPFIRATTSSVSAANLQAGTPCCIQTTDVGKAAGWPSGCCGEAIQTDSPNVSRRLVFLLAEQMEAKEGGSVCTRSQEQSDEAEDVGNRET